MRAAASEATARRRSRAFWSTLGLAALSRVELPPERRHPFFLYVDEFQTFTTLSFANLLTDLRKMGVGLVLAHQHLHQLAPEVRHAVFGNVGTLLSFRTGVEDAPLIAKEMAPAFEPLDLLNLPNRLFYVRMMIDGAPGRTFSGQLLQRVG